VIWGTLRGVAVAGLWLVAGLAAAAAPAKPLPPRPPPSQIDAAAIGMDAHEAEATRLGLRSLPGGRYRYVGTTGERFDATIEIDGTVTIEVDPSVQVNLDGICLVVVCVPVNSGRPAQSSPASPKSQRGRKAAKAVSRTALGTAVSALGGGYGTPHENYGRSPDYLWNPQSHNNHGHGLPQGTAPMMGGVSGRYGYLPKPNAQMAAFLERTFEFRLDMARSAHEDRLRASLAQLPHRLLDTWNDARLELPERRARILDMWDALEPALIDAPLQRAARSELEQDRASAANQARRIILEFVRRHLPVGSTLAFTSEETERFNLGRTSRARFVPYE
jgi:hypothetical protein